MAPKFSLRLTLSVALWVVASPARAGPALVLDVHGACPDAVQVRDALRDVVDVAEADESPGAWTLVVAASDAFTEVSIRDQAGTRLVVRQIDNGDCQAVAEACAVLVHAHVVERRAHPVVETTVHPPVGLLDLAPPDAVVIREPPPVVAERSLPLPDRPDRPDRPHTPSIGLGLMAGVDVAAASSSSLQTSGVARLDATWLVSSSPSEDARTGRAGTNQREDTAPRRRGHSIVPAIRSIVVRGVVTAGTATTTAGTDPVRQQQLAVRVQAGLRWSRGIFWVQPVAGAGLVISRVTAVDLRGPNSATRAHPTLDLGSDLGVRVAKRVSLRASIELASYPLADRYLIEPAGEVARSARLEAGAFLGVELAL